MLRPIFEAMEQVYTGDARGNPFAWLSEIDCPVRVATAEKSWAIYKEMAARAVALMPAASQSTFEGIGHCVARRRPTVAAGAEGVRSTSRVTGHRNLSLAMMPRGDRAVAGLCLGRDDATT